MRFAWLLEGADFVEQAIAAEAQGYDMVWFEDSGAISATAAAASLAVATTGIRVGITATVGDEHPIELAEEVTVADLVLGGRMVLAVRPSDTAVNDMAEILDLLLACFASHPFRHEGPRWPTPANLEQNVYSLEQRIRITPSPAQLELPLWVAGMVGRDAAVERGLGFVADVEESAEQIVSWWKNAETRNPVIARRVRRSIFWNPPMSNERVDVEAAVAQLRELQRSVGLDLVVVRPPRSDLDQTVMTDLISLVRSRVQLNSFPPGLEDHWAENENLDSIGEDNG